MSDFLPAYKLERKHEGFFANIPGDQGGKTYAGVAQKIYPNWPGFLVMAKYEATLGRALKTNEQVPGMEPYVEAFYKDLWNKNNFGAINNQDVANIVYDWFINSGSLAFNTKSTNTVGVDEILVSKFSKQVPVDGKLDTATINAINEVDSTQLYTEIKKQRTVFYNTIANTLYDYKVVSGDTTASIAKKYGLSISDVPSPVTAGQTIKIPTNKRFLPGWLSRINSFPTLAKVGIGIGGILLTAGLFFLGYKVIKGKKKKTK
jgi:lysozyme family protein